MLLRLSKRERERTGVREGATAACTVEIVMIMIELTRDEGHRDYMSDGTGDNDDVLSAFFSYLPLR